MQSLAKLSKFVVDKTILYLQIRIKIFGIIGFIFFIIGFIGKTIYREYIYSNQIDDWGIAGSIPSFFYVIGFAYLLLIKPAKNPVFIISMVTIGSILYEILQFYTSNILDYKDIYASVFGGITSLILLIIIEKYSKKIR